MSNNTNPNSVKFDDIAVAFSGKRWQIRRYAVDVIRSHKNDPRTRVMRD